ncbi:MAG: hypothetical protein BWX90_00981 [bacterium ADurb.Bin132]|nr:MAG: hypothetical protein BWX90_00981 [bacterium ADurb.Bin132]
MFDCKWIFCPQVNIGFGSTNSICRYCKPLYHSMRIAFDYSPVHESTGVTLVSIADHVFLVGLLLECKFPLCSSIEATTAPAPEARLFNHVADFLPGFVIDRLCKGFVTIRCDVFPDIGWVNNATSGKHPTGLGGKKWVFIHIFHIVPALERFASELEAGKVFRNIAGQHGIHQLWYLVFSYFSKRNPCSAR